MRKATKITGVALLAVALLWGSLSCAKSTSTTDPGELPTETTWISPGKVFVAKYRPGDRAEYPVTIYNSNYESLYYAMRADKPNPDRLYKGYAMPPEGVNEWVIFIDPTPVYKIRVEVTEDGAVMVGGGNTTANLVPETAHNLTAVVANEGTELSWTRGTVAERVLVKASAYRYPTDIDDGYLVYRGNGNSTIDHQGAVAGASGVRYYGVWAEATGVGLVRIGPRETKDVLVVLEVPEGEAVPRKYEFLVIVQEGGQGNVVIELASRWMISRG